MEATTVMKAATTELRRDTNLSTNEHSPVEENGSPHVLCIYPFRWFPYETTDYLI